MKYENSVSGQSLLTLVILIGGIILAAGISLALVTAAFVDSGFGYQASEQAQAIAVSGAEDALVQIARAGTGWDSCQSGCTESFAVGSSTATVTGTPNSPSSGYFTVVSAATVSLHIRKVQVILSQNSTTGLWSVVSWSEVQ